MPLLRKLVLPLLLLCCFEAAAQNPPELTDRQIRADFDTLCKKLLEISPQHFVRQQITGVDVPGELNLMRQQLADIRTADQFLYLVQKAVTLCQDGHTSLIRSNYYPDTSYYKERGLSDSAIALIPHYDSLWRINPGNGKKFNLQLRYMDGAYYNIAAFSHGGRDFPAGLRLLRCNGQPVQQYVAGLYPYLRMMPWDFKHRQYYAERFYLGMQLSPEDTIALEFEDRHGKPLKGNFVLNEPLMLKDPLTLVPDKRKKVEYWDKEKVLYIRLPVMEDGDYYPAKIRQVAAGKSIGKVVIDIRDNPGGSDHVWADILTALVKDTITYENFILCNNLPALRSEFPEAAAQWDIYKVPFLKNREMAVFHKGISRLAPEDSSLRYTGEIYVIQNENIYSAAGSLAAVGIIHPQIITAGAGTGRLLGRGVAPLLFELPHSKILYRIEPVIDFMHVKTAQDVFHDAVELPVPLTLDQYLERLKNTAVLYEKDFLLGKDPVFRKVMTLPGGYRK